MIGASPGLTLVFAIVLSVPVIAFVKYKTVSRLERIVLVGFTSGFLGGALVLFLMRSIE